MSRRQIRTLGVDLGNHNIKTSEKKLFKSVFEEFDYKNEIRNDDYIIYEGKKYVVGKGEFDNTRVKSEKKNTLPLYLNAIYQSFGVSCLNLRVVVGLPLEHHKNKQLVADMKEMYSGVFEFKYVSEGVVNDVVYDIQEVYVFPECLGSFYSLREDMEDRDILIIDIGGGTVNIALFVDGEYEDSVTMQEGTNDLYRQIMARANYVNTGASFSVEDILKYIKRGKIKWNGKTDTMPYVEEYKDGFVDDIMNTIKGKFPLYKSYEIKLSGGGADVLKSSFDKHIDFTIVEDNIFSNATGFYNVGVDMDE